MIPSRSMADGPPSGPTLYYAPRACVLEWIGAPYAVVAVDQHAPSYRAINPAGAVPALRYDPETGAGDGAILTQASAILHYLARRHPEAGLLDEDTPEAAAENDRWSAFLTGDLHPAFFPVFTPQHYTTATDPAALDAVRAAGLGLVAARIALLDRHLQGRTWMVGERRGVIDAYTVPMLKWAKAKLPGGLDPYAAVAAHHARILSDPAVRRVMEAEASAPVRHA